MHAAATAENHVSIENHSVSGTQEKRDSLNEPLLSRIESNDGFEYAIDENRNESDTGNGGAPSPELSKNIPLILLYSGLIFAGRSLWNQSVLSSLIFLLDRDAKAVGGITAVMGISQLLSSFPAGIIADRYRRDTLLKIASIVGCVAAISTAVVSAHPTYGGFAGSLAIWGTFWGLASTTVSALYADSVPDGMRSKYFTYRIMVQKAGVMVGPAVAMYMFYRLGDEWTGEDCGRVMMVGQAVCFPGLIVLWFLKDESSVVDLVVNSVDQIPEYDLLLREEGEHMEQGDKTSKTACKDFSTTTNLTVNESLTSLATSADQPSTDSDGSEDTTKRCLACFCKILENRTVPVCVATADICAGLAAGMSIRYFPIFFMENLGIKPIRVQILYILSPLLQIVLSHMSNLSGRKIGRLRTTSYFKWIGILFMIAMLICYIQKVPTWIVCALYIARTGFMNSTQALTKSVLMDAVPKNERAKWSALEGVNMFSWSGSAVLGGYLVGVEGIVFNFCVTAFMQFLATLPLVYLFSIRGDEEMELVE